MARPRSFDETDVLEKAMQEFWTNGYAGTSPADLVRATGLGKGSLYNAFTDKHTLFERCLELYHGQISEQATRLLQAPGSTKECLRSALCSVVDADRASSPRRGCLVGNTIVERSGHDDDLARRLRHMQDETTGQFAERIAQGQARGDVATTRDPRALADHLATTLAGLRVMAMTHDAEQLYRVIDTALDVI